MMLVAVAPVPVMAQTTTVDQEYMRWVESLSASERQRALAAERQRLDMLEMMFTQLDRQMRSDLDPGVYQCITGSVQSLEACLAGMMSRPSDDSSLPPLPRGRLAPRSATVPGSRPTLPRQAEVPDVLSAGTPASLDSPSLNELRALILQQLQEAPRGRRD